MFKRNEIATGSFVALGQRVDLTTVKTPMFLLAARDDELVAVEQLFATQRLVSTPPGNIRKAIVPCRHLGLFVGKMTLQETWPKIARWIRRPSSSRPESNSAYGEAVEVRPKGRPANVITSVSDI